MIEQLISDTSGSFKKVLKFFLKRIQNPIDFSSSFLPKITLALALMKFLIIQDLPKPFLFQGNVKHCVAANRIFFSEILSVNRISSSYFFAERGITYQLELVIEIIKLDLVFSSQINCNGQNYYGCWNDIVCY